jgi:hypothetical protein
LRCITPVALISFFSCFFCSLLILKFLLSIYDALEHQLTTDRRVGARQRSPAVLPWSLFLLLPYYNLAFSLSVLQSGMYRLSCRRPSRTPSPCSTSWSAATTTSTTLPSEPLKGLLFSRFVLSSFLLSSYRKKKRTCTCNLDIYPSLAPLFRNSISSTTTPSKMRYFLLSSFLALLYSHVVLYTVTFSMFLHSVHTVFFWGGRGRVYLLLACPHSTS